MTHPFHAASSQVVMIKVPLLAAAKTVRSFKVLEEQAPVTLVEFLGGYRDAMADIPAGDSSASE